VQLSELECVLGYRFARLDLLNQALTHKSFIHERRADLPDNERMEFLGDAVLGLVISDYLYARFPDRAEGDLSKLRAALVNEANLTRISRRLDLGNYLLLGRGEENTGGREKPSLLADTLEAVIAAIYLDSCLVEVSRVILRCFREEIESVLTDVHRDYKSDLQEYTLEKFGCIPGYLVIREYGPDHEKVFQVELSIRGCPQGSGVGKSKKEAEQAAARRVIESFIVQQASGPSPDEPPA
jgi:ribonuclease-3